MSIATSTNPTEIHDLVRSACVILGNADNESAIDAIKEVIREHLDGGLTLQDTDALKKALIDKLEESPELAGVVGKDSGFFDRFLDNIRALAGEENSDHLTFNPNFLDEEDAQYTLEIARYIALYEFTGHDTVSPEHLQSVLEDLDVPERLHASVAEELTSNNKMTIKEPEFTAETHLPAYEFYYVTYGLRGSDAAMAATAATGENPYQSYTVQVGMTPSLNSGSPA